MQRDETPKNETSLLNDNAQEERCLPDILEVYDRYPSILLGHGTKPWINLLSQDVWWRFTQLEYPVRFVRVFPPRIPTDKGVCSALSRCRDGPA